MHGAKYAPFIESYCVTSNNLYYRNKNHVPVILMHGAKYAPFIESYCVTSNNLYYRNKNHVPVIPMYGAKYAPFIESYCVTSNNLYFYPQEIYINSSLSGNTIPIVRRISHGDKGFYGL
jgi:hypothetical protein